MKLKKFLFLLLFIGVINIPVIVDAAAANTAFNDENLYKCVIDNINEELHTNYDYDHSVTDEELGQLTGLYCSKYSGADYDNPPEPLYSTITDFTGMEHMPNLEEINLSQSGATSIDLTHNTKLRIAVLRDSAFTNVDLSQNTKLVRFFAQNTHFTSLDFSHSDDLEYIVVSSNDLTTVNFGSINKVTYMELNCPKVSSIDLTHFVDLNYLFFKSNYVTSIDLSNNSKLDTLYIGGAQVSSLDINNLSNLSVLHMFLDNITSLDLTHNPKLYILDVHNDKITNLDLSKNLDLGYLEIESDSLKSIDISKNTELKDLVFLPTVVTTPIDFSHNTKLEQVIINLYRNTSTLDLSQNRKLKTLCVGLIDESNDYKLLLPSNVDVGIYGNITFEATINFLKVRVDDPVGIYEGDTTNTYRPNFPSFTTKENGSTIVKLYSEDESIKRDITLVVTGAESVVEVPNTAITISKIYFIASLILITTGFALILNVVYEKPKEDN